MSKDKDNVAGRSQSIDLTPEQEEILLDIYDTAEGEISKCLLSDDQIIACGQLCDLKLLEYWDKAPWWDEHGREGEWLEIYRITTDGVLHVHGEDKD